MDASFSRKVYMNLRHLSLNEKASGYYEMLLSMGLFPDLKRVSRKSAAKALEYRNLGNECFSRKDFGEALQYYTKSVSVAPPASAELAFAFANRSAALFKLKKFKASIVDINRALEENYPEDKKQKLHDRKDRCVSALSNPERNAVPMSEMLFRDSFEAPDDQESLENFDINSSDLNFDDKFRPPELNFQNQAIPCASEKVALKYSSTFGRHIVAVSDIKPGESLAVEKPISANLYWSFKYSHCANCFVRCECLIPCPKCTEVLFCSKSCLNDAFIRYHRIECQILSLSGFDVLGLEWRIIRLLIMVTKQGTQLESLMAHPVYKYPFVRAPEKIPDILDSQDYGNIHNLEDHHDKMSEHDMWMRIHATAYIIHVLKRTTFFEEQQDPKKFSLKKKIKYLGALLPKFLCLMPNTCDVNEWLNGKKMVMIGAAFFSFHSLMNHSCDDNVFRTFHKDTVLTIATRTIKAGEQLFDNYGMWYESDILPTRQKFLLERYHFKCRCVACENNWPDLMHFPSVKAQINKSEELKRYAKAVEKRKFSFNMLCEYLALLQEKTSRPNAEFHECQQQLTRMLIFRGNSYFVGLQEYYSIPYPKDNFTEI